MIPQLLLFALCAVPSQGYALRQGVTPVQKVIALLQDMMAKGKAEKVHGGIHLPESLCYIPSFLQMKRCGLRLSEDNSTVLMVRARCGDC